MEKYAVIFYHYLFFANANEDKKSVAAKKARNLCRTDSQMHLHFTYTRAHTELCGSAGQILNGKLKAFSTAPRAIRTTIFIVTLLNTYLLPLWPVYVCGISRILFCCLHFTRNYIPLPSSHRVEWVCVNAVHNCTENDDEKFLQCDVTMPPDWSGSRSFKMRRASEFYG